MAVYGYCRVSSRGQAAYGNGLEVQRNAVAEAGAQRIYEDVFTGTTMDRPQWDTLVAEVKPGDTIVVTKLDRIARTAPEGIETVRSLVDAGVSVRILNMGLIENTSVGRLMLTVMFGMAEFERDLIVERMAEGKAAAREREGYKEGRPKLVVDESKFTEVCMKVESGEISARAGAKELGISERTFRRRFNERRAA